MHDGRTRKVEISKPQSVPPFLESHSATITILNGAAAGTEFGLERSGLIIGRGANADLQIDMLSISTEHAVLDLDSKGFGIRDLASTNGVLVNGASTLNTELKHGDRIQLGECELQYVIESRTRSPRSWSVS